MTDTLTAFPDTYSLGFKLPAKRKQVAKATCRAEHRLCELNA